MKERFPLQINVWQSTFLVLLRIGIGWHFLWEGLVKVTDPHWSSAGYLYASHGPLAGLFHSMAETPWMLAMADQCTQWGLVFAGLSLMLGCLTFLGCLTAAGLLTLFYVATPAWGGPYSFGISAPGAEGVYMIVNKTLVELLAVLALITFPTGRIIGFDAVLMPMLQRLWRPGATQDAKPTDAQTQSAT